MQRLDRYIFQTVAVTALIALLVLVVLHSFFSLLGELDDLGQGSYDVATMFHYLLLTQPRRIGEVFPVALLVGGLLGMGGLAASSELVVMRAAGCSVWRLVWAALQAGLLLGLVALLIGEFIAPPLERMAHQLRSSARYNTVAVPAGQGFWARDGAYFISVQAVLPGPRLVDVYLYETGTQTELKTILWAHQASYSAADRRWVLEQVSRSSLSAERVLTEQIARLPLALAISPAMLEVLATDPKDLSLRELHTFIDYLQNNRLDARSYQLNFWVKAVTPLTSLAMLFIAMPFVFGSQRAAGTGQRLMIGVCLGLLFFLLNRLLSNLVLLYGYPPLLGALSPSALFFAAGAYGLQRVR
jgi:lipopolysaccharide export system permease protein